jgi:hypothetical protein
LRDGERRRIATHLADCQHCRNLVQGHRAVRAVLQLEAPPAPDGVLERVLATRAAGGVVVLPVVDPGAPGRSRGTLLALVAGAAAVLLLSLVQVVPMTPLANAWDWWSRTVVDWHPFGGGNGVRIPEMLSAPVADPAVLDLTRLRPVTVRYRRIDFRGVGRPPRVDTIVHQVRAVPEGGWDLRSTWTGSVTLARSVRLDATSFGPRRWTSLIGAPGSWQQIESYRYDGREMLIETSYTGDPPPRVVTVSPPGTRRFKTAPAPGTVVLFDEGHLAVALTLVDLDRRWAGSFAYLDRSGPSINSLLPSTTFMVVGSEMVETPTGTFDAWRLHSLNQRRESSVDYWVRKRDGILIRIGHDSPDHFGSVLELLSVSYP